MVDDVTLFHLLFSRLASISL